MGLSNGLATKDNRSNLVRAFKASGCAVCKKRYPELDWSELHIDHIDPRDKPRGVSVFKSKSGAPGPGAYMTGGGHSSVEKILTELLLCQVLCRKCHLEKHRNGNGVVEGQIPLFAGNGAWTYGGN